MPPVPALPEPTTPLSDNNDVETLSPRIMSRPVLSPSPAKSPFRLLPPVSHASWASSRAASFVTPSNYSSECRDQDLPSTYGILPGPRTRATETRRLQGELRSRPLTASVYGQAIVNLLTLPWVIAPSGLAATIMPLGTESGHVSDLASYINLLVCGAEAFAAPHADVLAVHNLSHLNRLLIAAGLSPITPKAMPTPWAPLAARQPPDFLLEGFRLAPSSSAAASFAAASLEPHG